MRIKGSVDTGMWRQQYEHWLHLCQDTGQTYTLTLNSKEFAVG